MALLSLQNLTASQTYQLTGIVLLLLVAAGYAIRLYLLPKPLPGIPYKRESAKSIGGDGLELLKWKATHGEMFGYLAKTARELQAPIFQIFVHPGQKPWIVIADNREAYDIMVRRTNKEFDRSRFLGDLFMPLVPEFHFHMPTGDRWKAHRKLVADTMSPGFLNEVAAPQMWRSTMKVVDLWRVKEGLADGRPFSVATDLRKAAFEIIWTATFGFETGAMKVQSDLLSSLGKIDLPGIDQAVDFPVAADPPVFKAVLGLNDAMIYGVQSFLPRLTGFLAFNTFPSLRAARKLKEATIQGEIKKAIDKFSSKTDIDWEEQGNLRKHMKSAVDIVIAREIESARKEGRAPDLLSRVVQDELFSFLLAGNEIFTLAAWTLKFLTAHQDVQNKLRQELRDQFKTASETGQTPEYHEITSARLPYLECVIEESTRVGSVTQTNIRTVQQDAYILGHLIPGGTEILMLNNGPGTFMPPLHVDEGKRSDSSKAAAGKIGEWDVQDIEKFRPERWLVTDEEGRPSFNANAGPRHSFGAGPRACFGRKWAALEVKIMIVLFVWHFHLEPTPEPLSSFKPKPGLAHRPEQLYLRLKAL